MVLLEGSGGLVRREWWSCKKGVVVVLEGSGGLVRRERWSCKKGAVHGLVSSPLLQIFAFVAKHPVELIC